MTCAKVNTPKIEYRYMNRIRRLPTLTSSGMARMKVLRMVWSSFILRMILMILAILNDLMMVVTAPTLMLKT